MNIKNREQTFYISYLKLKLKYVQIHILSLLREPLNSGNENS